MKKIFYLIIIMVVLIMTFSTNAIGMDKSGITQYIDKTLSNMVSEKKVKGAIVSVVNNGTKELCKGYGFSDEENDIAANEYDTAFRIGSISKTFVAIAAQQLVEKGLLDMKTSISIYLEPDFPKFKYNITMHDLLTHTAGFEDMISGIAVDDIRKVEPLSLSVRKYMPEQVFQPGEVVSYNNYGIALAAYVVQCITEEDFYKYAADNIFLPLGMTKTSFELDYEGVSISKGYSINGVEKFEPLMNIYPEGSVVSTATDMSKYIEWLMDDNDIILSIDSKEKLFLNQFTMSDEFEGMGYTWSRQKRNDTMYYQKKGETLNFYSRIVVYPELKIGVFISFNNYVDEEKFDAIMDGITNRILGQEEQVLYTGKQTDDISGYYISTRSNFKNPEKILNLLIPNKVFHITGDISKGFFINGKKLLPMGENRYNSPIGEFKYIEKNGKSYLANKTSISYVRTNWHESNVVQMFIVVAYIILSFILVVLCFINLFRRNNTRVINFLSILSITSFLIFICLCILVFRGISNYSMLSLIPYIQICGILITAINFSGILYSAYIIKKKIAPFLNKLLVACSISSILIFLWMIQVNIIF